MFAGAAREAVFSKAENIRRINLDFIPVALKAGLVYQPYFLNVPPVDEEGRLYREIARSMPAPQGIGIVNSAGKALDWVIAFDNDNSIPAFLDHARAQYNRYPDASRPVPTERFARFPSQKGADVPDSGENPTVIDRHLAGQSCPGTPALPKGTLEVRLFGRALDKGGRLVADTVRQENYVEERFTIPPGMLRRLTGALTRAGGARVRVADDLAQMIASHAYLGQLDLNPAQGGLKECTFWANSAKPIKDGSGGANRTVAIRIEGATEAAAVSSRDDQRAAQDGAYWKHNVKLGWKGILEVQNGTITRLLLLATGAESLKWDNKLVSLTGRADVTSLVAGHSFDLKCGVRYGLIGEPVSASGTAAVIAAKGADSEDEVPELVRRQIIEFMGPSFAVFGSDVQAELGLTDAQKRSLKTRFLAIVHDGQRFFRDLSQQPSDQRQPAIGHYQEAAREKLADFLQGLLTAGQRQRLGEVELQSTGLFALGRPDVSRRIALTDDQRSRFMLVVQEMQARMEEVIRSGVDPQTGGSPAATRFVLSSIRKDYEEKIRQTLTSDQRARWKDIIGKPFKF